MLFHTGIVTIVSFLFVIACVVIVHEFGHYIAARACGVTANAFSFGFGPVLVGYTDKRGTHWVLSAIPFGGYVSFGGEDDEGLDGVSLPRRAVVIVAGPLANYVFAVVLTTLLLMLYGYSVTPEHFTVEQLRSALEGHGLVVHPTLIDALSLSLWQAVRATVMQVDYLINLVALKSSIHELAGPVGIAQISGQAAEAFGFVGVLKLTTVISVALGFFNLIPILPLDGGRLALYLCEALFGKPNERVQEWLHRASIAFVIATVITVTWNDIGRIVGF